MEREQGAGAGASTTSVLPVRWPSGQERHIASSCPREVVGELPGGPRLIVVGSAAQPVRARPRRRGGCRQNAEGTEGQPTGGVPSSRCPDTDPARFATHLAAAPASGRPTSTRRCRRGAGGLRARLAGDQADLLAGHRARWPARGFEVIVPDLRGFTARASSARTASTTCPRAQPRRLAALVHDHLGHEQVIAGGRRSRQAGHPGPGPAASRSGSSGWWCSARRCPTTRSGWPGCGPRAAREASDYFVRQGTDPDGLAAGAGDARATSRRYIATFYTSRFWAHPGAFIGAADPPAVASAAARSSTSTPSRSPTATSCGRQLRWLRERLSSRGAPSGRRCSTATTARRRAVALRSVATTLLYPDFATAWRCGRSIVTWARSCAATAVVTSSRGRRRTRRQRRADDGRRPPRGMLDRARCQGVDSRR